ncbi:hypothetical protein [Paraburkholderia xenovorans]|nr:hypothetical protein [Paraburkholderia xenovorans]
MSLKQQLPYVAQAQAEPEIPAKRATDDTFLLDNSMRIPYQEASKKS